MSALILSLLAACDSGTFTITEPPGSGTTVDDSDTPADTLPDDPEDTQPEDTDDPGDTQETEDTLPPDPLGDLAAKGPEEVRQTDGTFQVDGCELTYVQYMPRSGTAHGPVVVLTHGFMRNNTYMRGWATHLASWGFEVYAPNLCHATVIDADHDRNGRDLAAFANTHLAGRPVVYAGHSAGGLASLLAGKHDPDALGVFGLDLVDSDNLGKQAADELLMPLWGLVAEPSWTCNEDNNGLAAYDRATDTRVWRIAEASHCDFENPTDLGCTTLCGWSWPGAFSDEDQDKAIKAMLTSFVLWASGVDTRALSYWTPGDAPFDALKATGILEGT